MQQQLRPGKDYKMAKDDYHVIVYKILLYLYGVMQRKIVFSHDAFNKLIERSDIKEEYLANILRLMQSEGLIEGGAFKKAWGHEYIMISDLEDLQITADGIRYLKENSTMNKVMKSLKDTPGLASSLLSFLKPF